MVAEPVVRISNGATTYDFVAVPNRNNHVVQRIRNDDFIAEFAEGGIRSPLTVKEYLSVTFPNFTHGVGRERIDSDAAAARKLVEYRRFWDATCDTRFASGTYAPILEEDSTHTGLEIIRASVSFKGDLWAIWQDDTSTDLVARKYTGSTTTWEGGGNVDAAGQAIQGLDLITDKTNMVSLNVNSNDHKAYISTDGASWTASSTQLGANLLSDAVNAHENGDFGLLATIGGETVAVLWHESAGTITFYSSTDGGDNWADEAVDIASGNGPQGVAVLAGIDNEDKLYVGTNEGLYEVDTAPSTWTFRLILSMVSSKDNCRRMTVHSDGALWFAQGVEDDTPPIVYRMFVSNGQREIERVPNDFSLGDGLVTNATGRVGWMTSAEGFMFIASGGAGGSQKAHIWCHNGEGWHVMRVNGTADQAITWMASASEDNDTPRLHYAVQTGASVRNAKFLAQPFANPASGVSIKRESTGYVDLPYIDGGFPLDDKNFLRVGVNASTLGSSATPQHINVDYGVTTDLGSVVARDNADLGDIYDAVSRLSIGTNGIGSAGRFLGLRTNINLGNAADTVKPTLKDIQVDFTPEPNRTRTFVVDVDYKKSDIIRGGTGMTTKAVIDDLETIEDIKTKVALDYSDISTKYVRILRIDFGDEVTGHESTGTPDSNSWREGTARITMSEILA